MITCPKCGSERFCYVQNATVYYHIDEVHEDGSVDLAEWVNTYDHDEYSLECEDCGLELDATLYLAMKEAVDEETEAQKQEVESD
jgi:hypothetical protein